MQELKLNGRMTVTAMKDLFKTLTGGTLRVKDGNKKADESATLASIRKDSDNKNGALELNPEMTVGDFKAKMLSDFGLKVEVGTPDDWVSVPDGITLGQLRELPKNAVKAQLEALIVGEEEQANADNEEGPFIEENPFDMDVHDEDEYDGDEEEEEEDEEDWDDENRDDEDEEETEKYGVIDREGNYVVEPIYDNINEFYEGLAIVSLNDKYGVINKKGEIVVEPQYDRIDNFEDGLAKFQLNDKYGFINKEGKVAIEPKFDSVNNFVDGLATVEYCNNYGFINKEGNYVIDPLLDWADSFHNGLAKARFEDKLGYIDKTGRFVIKPIYTDGSRFYDEGYAVVYTTGNAFSGGDWHYIDTKGNTITDLQPYTNSDNLEPFEDSNTKKWKYVNSIGDAVIEAQFDYAENFSDGLAAVKINGKYGFIDKTGNFVIKAKYNFAHNFSEGLAYVEDEENGIGFIDKTGKLIIDFRKENLRVYSRYEAEFHDGIIYAIHDTNEQFVHGFIDKTGKFIIELDPRMGPVTGFDEELALFYYENESPEAVGYIDKTGEVVIDAQFAEAGAFHDGVAIVGVRSYTKL